MAMPDPLTWKELDSLRCRCAESEVEPVEGMAHCLRCKTCRGWWGLRLSATSDLDKIRLEFGEARL